MTAVEVLSMTRPPYARLSTGRLPCVSCVLAGVHGASCPSASTRSPAAPWDPRLPPSDQRQGLCFIRTMLSGWAYGAIYRNGDERTAALDGWLWHHNCQRRHLDRSS